MIEELLRRTLCVWVFVSAVVLNADGRGAQGGFQSEAKVILSPNPPDGFVFTG